MLTNSFSQKFSMLSLSSQTAFITAPKEMSELTVTLGKTPASGGAQSDLKFYDREVEKMCFQGNRMGYKTLLGKSMIQLDRLSKTFAITFLTFSTCK